MRTGGIAAIASGVAWAVVLPLVAGEASGDPVGLRYDDWNRLLTLPLLLLVLALGGLYAAHAGRLSRWGRRGARLAVGAAALLVIGNVIEFWLVLLSNSEVFAIAEPRGLDEWTGSTVGWIVFLVGSLLLLAGGVLLGIAIGRAGVLPSGVGFVVGLTSPLLLVSLVVWSASVAATIVPAAVLGLSWVAIGVTLLRYRSSRYSSGTSTGGAASST